MDIHGYPWVSIMDIHGYPCISMDFNVFYGFPCILWISMDIHGYPWIPWISMDPMESQTGYFYVWDSLPHPGIPISPVSRLYLMIGVMGHGTWESRPASPAHVGSAPPKESHHLGHHVKKKSPDSLPPLLVVPEPSEAHDMELEDASAEKVWGPKRTNCTKNDKNSSGNCKCCKTL